MHKEIRFVLTFTTSLVYLCSSLHAAPIRIMPWGDSITGEENGYRVRLWKKLIADNRNLSFQFVGVSTDDIGDVPKDFESQFFHSGYAMETIADQYEHMSDFPELKPDILLLMIGTNDMPNGDASSAHTRLSALIDKAYQTLPTVKVVLVATICPRKEFNSNVNAYNAKIPTIIAEKVAAGKKLLLVDINKSITLDNIPDGVHPDGNGYEKLAQTWYLSLAPVLAQMNGTTQTKPVISQIMQKHQRNAVSINVTESNRSFSMYTLSGRKITTSSPDHLNIRIVKNRFLEF